MLFDWFRGQSLTAQARPAATTNGGHHFTMDFVWDNTPKRIRAKFCPLGSKQLNRVKTVEAHVGANLKFLSGPESDSDLAGFIAVEEDPKDLALSAGNC
jgi:hypothetical protein